MNKTILSLTAAAALFSSTSIFGSNNNNELLVIDLANTKAQHLDVQFKTKDGKIINATVHPKDLKGLKKGDKVELVVPTWVKQPNHSSPPLLYGEEQ